MALVINKKNRIIFWIFLIFITLIILFPIYWIFATSLKTPIEAIKPVPTLFPHEPTLQNYAGVYKSGFFKNLFNSIFVAVASTTLSVLLAFPASYALVRFNFPYKFKNIFLIWILVVKILPPVVLAIPIYSMFTGLGLVNSLWGLILVYQVYTIPYCIWMLFGFLKSLPINYEEAALIDGASKNYILWKVVFPLTRTGVIATTIFSIIMAWDEFLFALLFIRTPALRTLPLVIVNFIGEYETLWGELMGVGLLTTIPILIFSSFVYKYYTKGFSMGLK